MGAGDSMTVQVLNLSPRTTLAELNSFFSYCGTVRQIQLLRVEDQLPYALVTFGQPYAFQTALLLNDAIFEGQPICILPACAIKIPVVSDGDIDHTQASQGVIPESNTLRKRKEDLEKLKLSEKGRVLMGETRSAIYVFEQAAGRMGTAIMNNNYSSTGAARFSDVLDKASRYGLSQLIKTIYSSSIPHSYRE
ncbi:hypothetical protein CerSpe_022280 [Prunus speciosa]